MASQYLPIILILLLSIAIQATAAIMAIRLIGVTGRRAAWGLIAAALILMAVRRIVPLYRLMTGDLSYSPDMMNELFGLVLSLVMAIGISRIAPLFTKLKQSEYKLRNAAVQIEDLYENAPCDYHSLEIKDTNGTIQRASIISRNTTEELQLAEQLKLQQFHQEELVQQRTAELMERSRELQDNQQALMNIVDDLNQKTEELEQANTKLLELDQLKSMFIASMSHELRTPLNSIIGFSSIIRDEWLGPVNPEQKENLDTIQRSGKHLLSLINDVIDVSKIEAGRIEVRLEEFDLYDLLMEAIQYVDRDLRDKKLQLSLNIDHYPVCSDRRRLLQCVINLLSNAVKFTDQGEVSVSLQFVAGGPAVISIKDTGIGIAEEDISRLFKPFVRITSPQQAITPGTGLGLYLTRKLVVEVLGGDILCTSDAGKGSCFILRIPERIYEKGAGSRR